MPDDNQAEPQNQKTDDQWSQEIEELKSEIRTLKKRAHHYQALLDETTEELSANIDPEILRSNAGFDGITFIIVYYDIPKHIERTLISTSPAYQNAPDDMIEVIICDNGSSDPLPDDIQTRFPQISKILRTDGQPSPVFAMNAALKHARFSTVAMMIDGAHILSPGVFKNTREVSALYRRPVINVPQYFLGDVSQNLNRKLGAFEREEWHLKPVGWPEKPYAIFNYAVFPSENISRSLLSAFETNCLIAPRKVFEDCGGFDERFDEPGAGFANLEIFSRFINHPKNTYITLPGEGTFHQDHHGTTTNKTPEERDALVEKFRNHYARITGTDQLFNVKSPIFYGLMRRSADGLPTISKEFGLAKTEILNDLADIYVQQARDGVMNKPQPVLAVPTKDQAKKARPYLKPAGLLKAIAEKEGVDPHQLNYIEVLKSIQTQLKPGLYVETGVTDGMTLSLAQGPAIGIGTNYNIQHDVKGSCRLFRQSVADVLSNKKRSDRIFANGIDLLALTHIFRIEDLWEQLHLFAPYLSKTSRILIPHTRPDQLALTITPRRHNIWCGDVFKVVPAIGNFIPETDLKSFDVFNGPHRIGLTVIKDFQPAKSSHPESVLFHDDLDQIKDLETLVPASPLSSLWNWISTS